MHSCAGDDKLLTYIVTMTLYHRGTCIKDSLPRRELVARTFYLKGTGSKWGLSDRNTGSKWTLGDKSTGSKWGLCHVIQVAR